MFSNPAARAAFKASKPSIRFGIIFKKVSNPGIFQRKCFHSFSKQFQQNTTAAKENGKGVKYLMKKYGYAALGVYLGLSAIDLPLCYLLVASVGDEKIKEWQQSIKHFFGFGKKDGNSSNGIPSQTEVSVDDNSFSSKYGSFLTTFAIAYGVHKSLAVIRLPITAWITPSVVRILRRWGFKIGQTPVKEVFKATKDGLKNDGLSTLKKEGIKKSIQKGNEASKIDYSNIDSSKFGSVRSSENKRKKWFDFFF